MHSAKPSMMWVKTDVTISAGLAVQGEGTEFISVAALMCAADEAAYKAKQEGRDRWVQHETASNS